MDQTVLTLGEDTELTIDVLTVVRFMIGDLLGAIAVIIVMWVVFTTAIDTRMIISPEDNN